jgi:integrase
MTQELIQAVQLLSGDQMIRAWLDAKAARSGETQRAYVHTIEDFRQFLAPLDLIAADPRAIRVAMPPETPSDMVADMSDNLATAIALAAQTWAGRGEPAPTTYNRRLAVISSFYGYCLRQGILRGPHPLQRVERRRVQDYAHARALDKSDLATHLAAIPRNTPQGQRDYALLLIALHTGRRATELASLRCRHLRITSHAITIQWPYLKGGKTLDDTLPLAGERGVPGRALRRWLNACYGDGPYLDTAPVWPSVSRNGSQGKAISARSIANLCDKWLGVSQVHSLRHTFAKTMEEAGAKVSDIQARLGHTSLAVTGRYLARLNHSENVHLGMMSRLYGILADDEDVAE